MLSRTVGDQWIPMKTSGKSSLALSVDRVYQWIPPAILSLCCLLVISTWLIPSSDNSLPSRGPSDLSSAPSVPQEFNAPHPEAVEGDIQSARYPDNFEGFPDGSEEDIARLRDLVDLSLHRVLSSRTTSTGKYGTVDWGAGIEAYNPSIIPHPTRDDAWIVVGEKVWRIRVGGGPFQAYYCVAAFAGTDVLRCEDEPLEVAVADPDVDARCPHGMEWYTTKGGPRDPRVFAGPEHPYILYGSPSQKGCLGEWVQDARMLLDPLGEAVPERWANTTELRPVVPGEMEKNYHLFFSEGKIYSHTMVWPERMFSEINENGNPGENLATITRNQDAACYERLMPQRRKREVFHQATNALSITLCERDDPACVPDETNTFAMHLFHKKARLPKHPQYESYLQLYQSVAPFAVHAISQKPFWFNGHKMLTNETKTKFYQGHPEKIPKGYGEMLFVASINWKYGNWHGFLDDPLFIGFGVEDTTGAFMDVLGKDLLQDLSFC